MIGRTLARLASPAGPRAKLTVLIFHRVMDRTDPLAPSEPTAGRFDDLLRWLKLQLVLLPLPDAVRRLQQGTLPARAGAVTFDDGYRDNAELAAPLLRRHGVPATFFVATGFLDGGIMWNDVIIDALRRTAHDALDTGELGLGRLSLDSLPARQAALPRLLKAIKYLPEGERDASVSRVAQALGVQPRRDLMMTTAQVQELARSGFDIGGHTVNHPILTRLPDDRAAQEMAAGRRALQQITDTEVPLFAYPNGRWGHDFEARHAEMARATGFEAAFSTEWGVASSAARPFALPRFTPWDRSRLRFELRLARNMLAGPGPALA
jgi:peptidoglycan/xylan/chitin deacetylase (PgdA/CDA1 family)